MADSSSSSDNSTSSDFEETFETNVYPEEAEPFMGIQLWRFEPPGRNEDVQREEKVERLRRRCELDSEEW